MTRFGVSVFAVVATLGLVPPVQAQDHAGMVMMTDEAAIKWQANPAGLPKGTEIAVLMGDPSKPGPFVLRVKFQANAVVPPHRHATAENLTVLSGTVSHGMGETLDKNHAEEIKSGGFVYLPPMMPHSVWTGPTAAVVQVTGTGPFGLIYVRPAEDPNPAQ